MRQNAFPVVMGFSWRVASEASTRHSIASRRMRQSDQPMWRVASEASSRHSIASRRMRQSDPPMWRVASEASSRHSIASRRMRQSDPPMAALNVITDHASPTRTASTLLQTIIPVNYGKKDRHHFVRFSEIRPHPLSIYSPQLVARGDFNTGIN